MGNSLLREMRVRIALEEWMLEYGALTQEKDLIIQQLKVMSMMREIRLEFDLSVMSSSDERFSREVIFLYTQLEGLLKKFDSEMDKVT